MRATLLLCDAAQVADGKLYVLGGGWDVTGPTPAPSAVAVILHVPWGNTNQRLQFKLSLVHQDGQPVHQPGPTGADVPVAIDGTFEVGRPAGIAPGSFIQAPFAVSVPPLPLPPGQRFEWRLEVAGQGREEWTLPFSTRDVVG